MMDWVALRTLTRGRTGVADETADSSEVKLHFRNGVSGDEVDVAAVGGAAR